MGVTPHMYCCIPEVTVALAYRSSRQVDASTRLISPWNPFSRLQPVKAGPMITLVLYRCEASCLPLFLPQLSRTMIKCDPNHFSTGPGRWGHVWMCTGAQCWPSLCEDISSVHSSAADQASLDFQMSVLYVLCVCRRVGWQRSHFPGQTWSSQQCWKHSSSVFKSSSHLSLFSSKSSRLPISHTSLFLGGGEWFLPTRKLFTLPHTHTRGSRLRSHLLYCLRKRTRRYRVCLNAGLGPTVILFFFKSWLFSMQCCCCGRSIPAAIPTRNNTFIVPFCSCFRRFECTLIVLSGWICLSAANERLLIALIFTPFGGLPSFLPPLYIQYGRR